MRNRFWGTLISAKELQHQRQSDWLLVDVRHDLQQMDAGRKAWQQASIPEAIFLDIQTELSDQSRSDGGRHPLPATQYLQTLFSDCGIYDDRQVVVYDATHGAFAARLWWLLRYMGHEKVAVLDGGWHAWLQAGGKIRAGKEITQPKVDFRARVKKEWLVVAAEVAQQQLLIDSRDPARYRGEVEPLDPVAGHIRGALNRFWMENIDPVSGCFLAIALLRRQLLDLFGDVAPQQITWYCGSGVTACHNLLAQSHAGMDMGKLYAGSWSEWCCLKSNIVDNR